jgi:hypothetical protein
MTLRPVLAALAFTTFVLGATAASACDWNASATTDQSSKVASTTDQGSQQTPPAKTN